MRKRILPEQGIAQTSTKLQLKTLMKNISKKHVVLHNHMSTALSRVPQNCIVDPARSNILKQTAEVNAVRLGSTTSADGDGVSHDMGTRRSRAKGS